MELVAMLQERHGMGHGHANAIVAHTLAETKPDRAASDDGRPALARSADFNGRFRGSGAGLQKSLTMGTVGVDSHWE
jgi:hypothetical protein